MSETGPLQCAVDCKPNHYQSPTALKQMHIHEKLNLDIYTDNMVLKKELNGANTYCPYLKRLIPIFDPKL